LLKEKNIIKCTRSHITILNLPTLEAEACVCYRTLRDEYDRLLGPLSEEHDDTTH